MTSPEDVALWEAINEYVVACGGKPEIVDDYDRRVAAAVKVGEATGDLVVAEIKARVVQYMRGRAVGPHANVWNLLANEVERDMRIPRRRT